MSWPPESCTITATAHPEFRVSGKYTVRHGDKFTVKGERGKFTFQCLVRTDRGIEWVEAWKNGEYRAVRPERVKVKK